MHISLTDSEAEKIFLKKTENYYLDREQTAGVSEGFCAEIHLKNGIVKPLKGGGKNGKSKPKKIFRSLTTDALNSEYYILFYNKNQQPPALNIGIGKILYDFGDHQCELGMRGKISWRIDQISKLPEICLESSKNLSLAYKSLHAELESKNEMTEKAEKQLKLAEDILARREFLNKAEIKNEHLLLKKSLSEVGGISSASAQALHLSELLDRGCGSITMDGLCTEINKKLTVLLSDAIIAFFGEIGIPISNEFFIKDEFEHVLNENYTEKELPELPGITITRINIIAMVNKIKNPEFINEKEVRESYRIVKAQTDR